MSTGPISCTVLIDGVPISDGCSSLNPDDPAVLSGLMVRWGRDSNVDQPAASSCVFDIDDPIEGARIIPSLTIGRQVDVRTDTTVYPDPTVSTIPVLINTSPVNATTAGSGTTTSTVTGAGATNRVSQVTYPPRALSSNPTAWDAVPRALAGQAWRLIGTVGFPAVFCGWRSQVASIRAVSYLSPAGPPTQLPDLQQVRPTAPTADFTFTPPPGVWLGLQLRIDPNGPRWSDLDATSWNAAPGVSWDQLVRFTLSAVQMLAPAAGAVTAALVFSGRITDVISQWDGGPSARVQVIAQDWLAELANRFVGDAPWSVEGLGARAQRIVAASGQPVTLTVDPGVSALPVSYRDVDRQAAAALLQQLATSCGGVLWTATHLVTGQVMRLEDVNARPAAKTVAVLVDGYVHVVPSSAASANALPITACDFEVDPVRFSLDTTDTVSIVAVQWMEQTTDPGPPVTQKPTQRTVEVNDPAMVAQIGARRLSVSGILTTEANATAQANQWLARSSALAWSMSGLRWDTADDQLSPADVTTVMQLLNGTTRIGLLIAITDLPEWVQPMVRSTVIALYVEGGTYRFEAGAWVLELITSSVLGSTGGNLPWNALPPEWVWANVPVAGALQVTNMMAKNPSFEAGLIAGDWVATGGTASVVQPSQQAVPGRSGANALRITATAAAPMNLAAANAAKPPIVVGKAYRVSVSTRIGTSGAAQMRLDVSYRNSSQVVIGTVVSSPVGSLNAWQRLEAVLPAAPAGAVTIGIVLNVLAVGQTGQGIDWDAISVVEDTGASPTYFDGDTPSTATTAYAWTGTAGSSTSTQTPLTSFAADVAWLDLYGVTYP